MRLSVRVFGLELLTIEASADEAVEDDTARDLSGGTCVTDRIDAGTTDFYMGFTNGREVE